MIQYIIKFINPKSNRTGMNKVSTMICKYLAALYSRKDPFEVYKLRNRAIVAIEKYLRSKYPSEMSGIVEVDYEKATRIRTLGHFGLIPNALFMSVFLIMHENCKMSPKVAAHLCKDAYVNGNCNNKEEFLEILEGFEHSDFLFNDELTSEFLSLPQHLTIFRAGSIHEYDNRDFGCSWTTDRVCAEFFAFRFSKQQRAVFSMEVDKSEIIYFGNDRHESEVIYTNAINNEEVTIVTIEPTEYYQEWFHKH